MKALVSSKERGPFLVKMIHCPLTSISQRQAALHYLWVVIHPDIVQSARVGAVIDYIGSIS